MPTTEQPTAAPYAITFVKGDHRYYVHADGVKIGWVSKGSDGKWAMWAPVTDAITGTRLSGGEATRRDAVMEGMSSLRIWHLGRLTILNMDTMRDEPIYLECDRLEATWSQLLDEKYGL